ncbi:uncharacterized protein J4E87_008713 [Alternaria ethzedia]|uniref:uncharacterized protein n=1 Tax=Alternaria ethzedia TaxID=181014 RepID=UPI0020C2F488|nr:uncharacterized protein J4E87_008713 [Alternaria ethzedia]KAI4616447.1 hypothetical protein J4E87_008713 [Alternaria ethzedia]
MAHARAYYGSTYPAGSVYDVISGQDANLQFITNIVIYQVPLTIFETATATDTVTATETITNTATETSTITEQTTIFTATSPVIAIPTFTVYAIGGDNSGNPIADASVYIPNTTGNEAGLSPVLHFTTVDNNKLQVLNGPYAGSVGKTNPNVGATEAYK